MNNQMQQMLKQAQAMQQKMMEAQNQLEQTEVEGASGGGMVKVRLNGKNEMRGITLDQSLLNAEEKDMLEDLIVAAYNDARSKIEAETAKKMGAVTGGMQLPGGLKLPF
jgi:DNA-binding YbaB/EbfC family protein